LMIVDFAVENDGRIAVVRHYRLIAASQIDNLEADPSQADMKRRKDSLLVWTPMH
jgi:hypothetical protein